MEKTQADLISAIPHETLGFKHIIQNRTDWGRDARFSSFVNFVNMEPANSGIDVWVEADREGQLQVKFIYEEQQHDKTDLWLLCRLGYRTAKQRTRADNKEKILELYFRYSKRLYQRWMAYRIANLYCEVLASMTTAPDALISIPDLTTDSFEDTYEDVHECGRIEG